MITVERDPRLCLAPGTRVLYRGKPHRVFRRELDARRRPGLGRVYYELDPAVVMPDGSEVYRARQHVTVAAAKLEVAS